MFSFICSFDCVWDLTSYILYFSGIKQRAHDYYDVDETKMYRIRFCRVGARAAANRGYVSRRKCRTTLEREAFRRIQKN